jgi:hypothetical protein
MKGRPLSEAIAYVKAEVPDSDLGPVVALNADDSPVLMQLGNGLLVAYLVDEGDHFSYVQGRDLLPSGLDLPALHRSAVANLADLAHERVTIRQSGPIWALFLDGNLEASLLLLDDLWDEALGSYHAGNPVIAIPARDVICFCDAASSDGVRELRAVVGRVWPAADHLISERLFRRQSKQWLLFDGSP